MTQYTYWFVTDSAKPLEISYYETFKLELQDGEDFGSNGKSQWWWCDLNEKKEGSDLI